jgi:hypothetical protein
MASERRPRSEVGATWSRMLAALVQARGGELRLPRHYLEAVPRSSKLTATVDPVTDDVVIRILRP